RGRRGPCPARVPRRHVGQAARGLARPPGRRPVTPRVPAAGSGVPAPVSAARTGVTTVAGAMADESTPDEPIRDDPASRERTEGEAPAGDEDVVDELPEDLDAAGYVGPYLFP